MAYLIDSSIIIALERGRRYRPEALAALASPDLGYLAAITASELLAAIHRADTPEQRQRHQTFVEETLAHVPVLAFDLPAARHYARVLAELRAASQPIDCHDLLIAATALAYGYSVLTDNFRDFWKIPGLVVGKPNWQVH